MDRVSKSVIGQTLNPVPMSGASDQEAASEPVALEQIVTPDAPPAAYTGPERRAQGYLVAEILPESPAVDGQAPEFDRPR